MNRFQPLLMNLLRLDANQLDAESAERLRSLVRDDPNVGRKWKALRIALENRWQERPSPPGTNGVPTISPQSIARFLEDRLDLERLEQLELACWQHPQTLQTVVELFQLQQMPVEDVTASPALTERLLEIGAMTDSAANPVPAEMVRQIQIRTGVGDRRTRIQPREPGRSLRTLVIAASIAGLALAGTAWLIWKNSVRPLPNLAGPTTENNIAREPGPVPDLELPNQPEALVPGPDLDPIVRNPVAPPDNTNPGNLIPESVPLSDPVALNPSQAVANNPDKPVAPVRDIPPPALAIRWTNTEGLVAVRNPGDTKWSGIGANGFIPRNGLTSFVLPGSLARMELGSLGTLNMAPNTLVSWQVDPQKRIVESGLTQGGLLLDGAAAGTVWQVTDGEATWTVTIEDDNTSLGIDGETGLDEPGSRLFVTDGSAIVNGTVVQRRQQIVQVSGRQNEPTRFSRAPDWVRSRPGDPFDIPGAMVQQLIGSEDLAGDIQKLLSDNDTGHHDVARFCLASIDPQVFDHAFLANVDPRVRQQGITWLLQFQGGQQGLRQFVATFARTHGALELGRALPRLVQSLRTGQRPAYADTVTLIAGLNHDQQPVRQLAADMLDRIFGTRVPYQADAAPAFRQRAANAWQAIVDEAYGRPANRRRGQ